MKISLLKKQLRIKTLHLSKKLDKSYKKKSSKIICNLITSTSEYKNANTIFCFIGMDNEVDTTYIINNSLRDGKNICIPLIISKGIMIAKKIESLSNLQKNSFGILEPSKNNSTIENSDIDLCIVPCLSCSHKGIRLGYGGGYYDRYMQNQNFTKMCICYEKLTNEDIPLSKHDVSIDYLVTEVGIQKFI